MPELLDPTALRISALLASRKLEDSLHLRRETCAWSNAAWPLQRERATFQAHRATLFKTQPHTLAKRS
jgi:hypothetical protein